MSPRPISGGPRALLVGLAAAAVLVGASCGGGEQRADPTSRAASIPSPTSTLPYEQWRGALDTSCTELNTRYAELADAQPVDAAGAVVYAADVDRFVQAIETEVDAAGVPGDHREQVEDLQRVLDDLSAATRTLARAADDRDAEAVGEATVTVRDLATRVNPLAETLGVPACGGF